MNQMPAIALVSWEDRKGNFIFVHVPDEKGRYIRTDKSVALVGCPRCGSIRGEPCKSNGVYHGSTHADRRGRARHNFHLRSQVDDILAPSPQRQDPERTEFTDDDYLPLPSEA